MRSIMNNSKRGNEKKCELMNNKSPLYKLLNSCKRGNERDGSIMWGLFWKLDRLDGVGL